MNRGDTGAAMAWALKSQDAKFTTFLADKLLSEYATTGRVLVPDYPVKVLFHAFLLIR
jgi:hypothetical protein